MAWEAAGGVALLAAAVAALVWANVAPDAYAAFWAADVAGHSLTAIVNDGLMTIFFLLIGLEVKRELAIGELSDRRAAALPFAAALGGMLVPAGIYLAITAGSPAATGWGIPMATDVAFALAVLASLRSRVPPSLWAFLLGVAVIDDIGAIIVIAVAYSDGITAGWLAAGIGSLLAFWVLVRMQVRWVAPYVVVGVFVLAAILTPPDPVSQTLMAVPMCALWEIGLLFCKWFIEEEEEDEEDEIQAAALAALPASESSAEKA